MKRWPMPLFSLVLAVAAGAYCLNTLSHGQVADVKPPVIPKELTSYRDIVKKVLPAVVSIEAKSKTATTAVEGRKPNQPQPQFPPDAPEEFRKFFEEFGRVPDGGGGAGAGNKARLGFGSGFFVDDSGVVVTNFHVVEGADHVVVHLQDGRKFTSKEIRNDRRTDLAIIKLDLKGAKVPFLQWGDSNAMEIGDRVLAVGAPFGLTGSVTNGIISAKGRNGLNMNMYEDFLQTDAAINPGNSGGPLVNLAGQVIGINAAIKSHSGGFQGVGLAVASNLAKHVVKSLLADGIVRRGYLGVQIRDLTPEVADKLGLKQTAVVISEVFDRTPASKAGLQPGDVITAIGGKSLKDGRSLQSTIAGLPIGKAVDFAIIRDGKAMNIKVTIEEQPAQFGASVVPAPRVPRVGVESKSIAKVGVDVADMNDNLAQDFGYRAGTQGVIITGVQPDSLAAAADLQPGMLILKIDGKHAANAQAAQDALQSASMERGVLLQVQSAKTGVNFVLLRNEAA